MLRLSTISTNDRNPSATSGIAVTRFTRNRQPRLGTGAVFRGNLTRVKSGHMANISGKTIAITGAARGIGFATAKALLARGARVVIGDRDVATLESAVATLSDLGRASGHPLDVTDPESFARFLDKARTDGDG